MRVTTRSSNPRAKTETSMWGASTRPSSAGSEPGLTVTMANTPSSSVAQRPKPRKADPLLPRGSSGCANRPSGSACHVSTMASVTAAPAPSSTWPLMRMAPGVPSGTTLGPSLHANPRVRKGPAVCDGVSGSIISAPIRRVARRRCRTPENDVPHVRQRPFRFGEVERPVTEQAAARRRVGDGHVHGIEVKEWVIGEVHLGHQTLRECSAEQREVDVGGPPGVGVIPPRVRARPDGDEAVPSLGIGDAAAGAGEVGIQRGGVLVDGVGIPTRRVRLPHLDQGVADRTTALVEDTAGDDDALTLRLTLVLSGEVVVEWSHAPLPEERTGDLRQLSRQQAERLSIPTPPPVLVACGGSR